MYWVEYYCPRQSPFWQRRVSPIEFLQSAIWEAEVMKPGGMGQARVIDGYTNQVVYQC